MQSILGVFQSFAPFLADDPVVRLLQGALIVSGAVIIFFVFYTTRDVLLRSRSFWFMLFCIVLVTVLPVIGFLVYLLIRPDQTLKERETRDQIVQIARKLGISIKKPETKSKKTAEK